MMNAGYSAEVIADSLAPNGARLTTLVATYPRLIHAEMLTHRMFSRNSSSSRAIPTAKLVQQVRDNPVMPIHWGRNRGGMVATEELSDDAKADAEYEWFLARDYAVIQARTLADLGVHKQLVNRLLEPFSWITTIITGTEWDNFFRNRCHHDAQPEIQRIANMMRDAYQASVPVVRAAGGWHLPFVYDSERAIAEVGHAHPEEDALLPLSVARCARVSYLTHDGQHDPDRDRQLYERLLTADPPHLSPFEHAARAMGARVRWSGNFQGWEQYRKMVEAANEH